MTNDDGLGKPAISKTAVLALGLAIFTTPALAQSESVAGTSTVTVQNSFSVSESVAPSPGSVALIADTIGVDTATVTVLTDGTVVVTPNGDANAIIVDDNPANAAEFQITNAAPNTPLVLTFNNIVDLTCGLCTAGNPAIQLSGLNHDAGATPTTDGAGSLTFHVGFTLTTVAGGNPYEDGVYTGSFNVNIAY